MEKQGELGRIQIYISGRVQGVNFRNSAKVQADKLNIKGFAKNRSNGTIKIVGEGDQDALEELLQWSFRGSIYAKVTGLKYKWMPYTGEFKEFTVIREKNDLLKDQIKAFKNLGKQLILLPQNINVPQHIAIIPDGNRRWAKSKGLPTIEGHKAGLKNIIELSRASRDLGIKYLTVWGFSTENWGRDEEEVSYLVKLFGHGLKKYSKDFHKEKVRFKHIGRRDRLPSKVIKLIEKLESETAKYDKYYVNIALDYGGQDEILRAISKASENGFDMKNLTTEQFSSMMDTDTPDPDLIIRTSGEKRLSGLMPWQSTYAELYFTNVHFPDFDENELRSAIMEYSYRHRRRGK